MVCSSGTSTICVRSEMSSLVWGTGVALLSDTMRRELVKKNNLHSVHEVLHDLGHGHAHYLLDDFFQSCDSLDQRGRSCPANDADAISCSEWKKRQRRPSWLKPSWDYPQRLEPKWPRTLSLSL